MRYKSAPILICLVAAALSCARPPPIAHDEVLVTALASIALTPADLAISGDTLADADRFDKVKKLLENPQDAMDILPAFDTLTAGALLGVIAPWLGPELPGSPVATPDPEVPEPLQALVRSLMICQGRLARVYGSFSAEDRRRFASFIHLVHPGVALTETASDSLIAIGHRIDRAELVAATRALLTEVDTFVASVPALIPGTYDTPAGRVVIGGIGPDDYASPAALIIDPGGNDRYACFPDSLRWGSLSLVIDFSGDDTYEGPSGCGFGGVGIVIDLAGEDRYAGTGTGQGAGIGGVGVLVDRAGDDAYTVDLGGQGFGLYGVGLLIDEAGDDHYFGALLVQGVGAPGGIGILADGAGSDTYFAGGKYADFRENGHVFQSMAQGFGYGVRPLASGGMGFLVDAGGDDRYEVGYFGQGAGFWGSAGVLIDRRGNDSYLSRRYAQGCGVHVAVGILVDEMGNDRYDIWGVGQGCGHDLALGRLIDRAGNDAYRATWLAQGVGNANGVGWLDDAQGNDRYEAEGADCQGYGNPARDFGSPGLLIDRGGLDQYRGAAEKGAIRPAGSYGVALDWPFIDREPGR